MCIPDFYMLDLDNFTVFTVCVTITLVSRFSGYVRKVFELATGVPGQS